jgi:hypothetical protein
MKFFEEGTRSGKDLEERDLPMGFRLKEFGSSS